MNKIITHKNCIFCNSNKIYRLNKYANAHLVQCENCKLIFSNRIPSNEELLKHYKKYIRPLFVSEITINRYNKLLDAFEKYRNTNNILDIGCGSGFFLEKAQKRGWNVYGTEFDPIAVELCNNKGINCYLGKIFNLEFKVKFDIITSFEVIEHINNPKEEIETIYKLLRQNGILYLTTPNFNSFSKTILGNKWIVIEYPEHLTYYTKKTLHNLLKTHGFKKIYLKTEGIDVNEISKLILKEKKSQEIKQINLNEDIRIKTERNLFYKITKQNINQILSIFNIGDTIKALYEKQ